MTDLCGQWAGLKVIEARSAVIDYLQEQNRIDKIEEARARSSSLERGKIL